MIDRKDLVTRHNPILRAARPADSAALAALSASPLSVGNGEFAFTADFTGLQTVRDGYQLIPLCTMAQWGWHSFPVPLDESALRLKPYDTYGRSVGYASDPTGQQELFDQLRQNPHRLHLGAVGFAFYKDGHVDTRVAPEDYTDTEQTLDLWNGVLRSGFRVNGRYVGVETLVDAESDTLAVRVALDESWNLANGDARIEIVFPYGSPEKPAADWDAKDRHRTDIDSDRECVARISRQLDADTYQVALRFSGADFRRTGAHTLELVLRERVSWLTASFGATSSDCPAPPGRRPQAGPPIGGRRSGTGAVRCASGIRSIPAHSNWKDGWSCPNISQPSSVPGAYRPRKPDSPATAGTGSFTSKCTPGMPPIFRSGAVRICWNAAWTGTSGPCPSPARSPHPRGIGARAGPK